MNIRKSFGLLFLLVVVQAAAETFPVALSVGDNRLNKVAEARYSVLWKRITDVALYVDRSQSLPVGGNILDPGYSKYLTIEYGLSVSAERFERMSRDLLVENWPADVLAAYKREIDTFCSWLQAVKKGDRYAVFWLPEEGLSLAFNGEVKGLIESEQAAVIILSLWLGQAAVSESQRDTLLDTWRASI